MRWSVGGGGGCGGQKEWRRWRWWRDWKRRIRQRQIGTWRRCIIVLIISIVSGRWLVVWVCRWFLVVEVASEEGGHVEVRVERGSRHTLSQSMRIRPFRTHIEHALSINE